MASPRASHSNGTTGRTPRGGVAPPSGRVTFLFTDIEGSTLLLDRLGSRPYAALLADHHRLLRAAAARHGGYEVDTQGDALFVAFATSEGAIEAATDAQRAVAEHRWPEDSEVRVRMGILTGEGTWTETRYVGLDVHRAARLAAAAHGGQVLVSDATRASLGRALGPELAMRELGHFRLKDFASTERIHQLVIAGLQDEFPPVRALPPPTNLPVPLTSLVGRADELAELVDVLSSERLLTLVGPGGAGKTRLALELASRAVHDFRDGVYCVRLETVTDPGLVASAAARVLLPGETDARAAHDQVADFLVDKQALVLFDNFEQVAEAGQWLAELVRTATGLTVVVTSRAPLHVPGERRYAVQPLAVPADDDAGLEPLGRVDAVRLFVERARAVNPRFALTDENASAVVRVVRLLDGLPLAIELAAARANLLAPDALVRHLESRLGELSSVDYGVPERHRTLRATIGWSYELLDERDRHAFARLGAFVGGMELEAAAHVLGAAPDCGDALDRLSALFDGSLLLRDERAGESRFSMLQTIREFALERLRESGELDAVLASHTAAFVALAEEAEPRLSGADPKPWLDRLEAEHENLRAALGRSLAAGDVHASLRLVAALWRYWQMRGYLDEAREHVRAALALPSVAGSEGEFARALEAAGGVAYWQSDFDQAQDLYHRALVVHRTHGGDADVANALYNLSFTYSVTGADQDAARRYVEESLELFQRAGDRVGTAKALFALGNVAYFEGDFESARSSYAASLELAREVGDAFSTEWALYMLALAEQALGNVETSAALYREAFDAFSTRADVSGSVLCLNALADLALARGELERAATLAGAAAALEARSGATIASFAVRQEQRSDLGRLRHSAPGAWGDGERLAFEDAVAYALDVSSSS